MNEAYRALTLGLLAVLVTVFGAVVGWCWSGGPRGELAGWITALATASAVGAAVAAAVFAARALKVERTRDVSWYNLRRAEQALKVAAWVTNQDPPDAAEVEGSWTGHPDYGVLVRNASEVPVTSVRVIVSHDGQELARVERPLLPPESAPVFWTLDAVGQSEMITLGLQGVNLETSVFAVELRFTDAAGVTWERLATGQLRETEPGVGD